MKNPPSSSHILAEITADGGKGESEAILVSDTSPRTDLAEDAPAAQKPFVTVQHKPARVVQSLPARPAAVPGAHEPESDYDGGGLMKHILVYPWPYSFNFYHRFLEDARRYANVRGSECPYAYFFSFIPQYYQMSESQLHYYFYFREACRRGERLDKLEFSYVLLYIYELINLPAEDPARRAEMLAWIWCTYRFPYMELDKYLSEWMCDFCIVHRIPIPESILPLFPVILRKTTLREFYLSTMVERDAGDVPVMTGRVLIAACSEYDFRASRFYEKYAGLYDKHIPAAVEFALRRCDWFPEAQDLTVAEADRDAFCGTLCAQTVKRRLHLTYYSIPGAKELQNRVTAAVKLAENCIRRAVKIKSRLQVQGSPSLTDAVELYFQLGHTSETVTEMWTEQKEYAHLYEAPSRGMDSGDAHRLEAASWENTALLTDAEKEQPAPDPLPADDAAEDAEDMPAFVRDALTAVLAGEDFSAWCRQNGKKPALCAAEINDYAADRMGDVVLEDTDGWTLIEDYREEIASWLN